MRQDVQVRERAAGILGSWEQLSWHSHVYGEVSGGGFFFCFSSVFPFFLLRRKKKGRERIFVCYLLITISQPLNFLRTRYTSPPQTQTIKPSNHQTNPSPLLLAPTKQSIPQTRLHFQKVLIHGLVFLEHNNNTNNNTNDTNDNNNDRSSSTAGRGLGGGDVEWEDEGEGDPFGKDRDRERLRRQMMGMGGGGRGRGRGEGGEGGGGG